jgi:hypothetical protein
MDRDVARLERLLKEECEAHRQVARAMSAKIEALRRGDRDRMEALCESENACVQRAAEVAKARVDLVMRMSHMLNPTAMQPMRLNELAESFDEPVRGRLLVLRQQLRDQMEACRAKASNARRSTESMVKHMQGIMQMIGTKLSGVATYGRRGAPPQVAMAMSTFSATG